MKIKSNEWTFLKYPIELTKDEYNEVVDFVRELLRLANKTDERKMKTKEIKKLVVVMRLRLKKQVEEREKLLLAELNELEKI